MTTPSKTSQGYGLIYNALHDGLRGEWLLNYRGGLGFSSPTSRPRSASGAHGSSTTSLDDGAVAAIRPRRGANMTQCRWRRRPRSRFYSRHVATLGRRGDTRREIPGIPLPRCVDDEVLAGDLSKYDWVHLHHEDFHRSVQQAVTSAIEGAVVHRTGDRDLTTARRHGFRPPGPPLKKAVAEGIRTFVERGGCCSPCGGRQRRSILPSGSHVDIAGVFSDWHPDWIRMRMGKVIVAATLAFPGRQTRDLASIQFDERHRWTPGERPSRKARWECLPSSRLREIRSRGHHAGEDHRTAIPDFYGVRPASPRHPADPTDVVLAFEEWRPMGE